MKRPETFKKYLDSSRYSGGDRTRQKFSFKYELKIIDKFLSLNPSVELAYEIYNRHFYYKYRQNIYDMIHAKYGQTDEWLSLELVDGVEKLNK